MGFVLTVSKGPGQGTDFEFDQAEARLGRTADNDIVVKDSGASRSHCRVFAKGGRFFVEDLKSANGTKLNQAFINGAKELKPGDTITIGDISFSFSVPKNNATLAAPAPDDLGDTGDTGEDDAEEADAAAEDPNSTLLKPPRKPSTARNVRSDTEAEVGTVPRGKKLQEDEAGSTREVEIPPPRALAKVNDETRPVPPRPSRASEETRDVPPRSMARRDEKERGLKKAEESDDEPMTAADRARARREAQKSALGRVSIALGDMSTGARIFTYLLMGIFAVGTVGGGLYLAWPKPQGPKKIEPTELIANSPAVRDSFGTGEGVEWQRPDMKVFQFSITSPTKVVAVLHYMARDISKEEVSINANGTDLGFVPPDTIDVKSRELEVVLPPTVVKLHEPNNLIFDSLRNPPGDDPWRVWNIWLELLPVPDMGPEETARAAKEDIATAEKAYEMRDIGAENLFRAWKSFREAWLLLESLPDKPQDLYTQARTRMREVRPELDKQCNGLLVEYEKAMNAKPQQRHKAIGLLKDVERFFPTREHPCYGFSKELLQDMGEW